MTKWVYIAVSVLMSCVLLFDATQLSTYARTVAVNKEVRRIVPTKTIPNKLAQIPDSSLKLFIQTIINASNACVQNTKAKAVKGILSTLPESTKANIVICPELIALVQSNTRVASTGGVLELPLLAQIFNTIIGVSVGGLSATAIAIIAGVIVIALLIIGLTWCITHGEKCKARYDSIKRTLDEYFDTYILSMLRKWTKNPEQVRQIEQTVKSDLNKEWNDTKSALNSGEPPTAVREKLERRFYNVTKSLPPSPNNNTPRNGKSPGSALIPPRSSSSHQHRGSSEEFYVSFLTPEQIEAIRAIDPNCANQILEIQRALRDILRAINGLSPDQIKKLRDALDKHISEVLHGVSKNLYNLRGALESGKGKIPDIRNGKSLDDLIKSLPNSPNQSISRKDAMNIFRALKKYLNLDNTRVVYKPNQTFNVRPASLDQLLFGLLSELHSVMITQFINFKEAMKYRPVLCEIYDENNRDRLTSDAHFLFDYINTFLCDIAASLDNGTTKDLCSKYAGSYRDFVQVSKSQTIHTIRPSSGTTYMNDPQSYIMKIRNIIGYIMSRIEFLLNK